MRGPDPAQEPQQGTTPGMGIQPSGAAHCEPLFLAMHEVGEGRTFCATLSSAAKHRCESQTRLCHRTHNSSSRHGQKSKSKISEGGVTRTQSNFLGIFCSTKQEGPRMGPRRTNPGDPTPALRTMTHPSHHFDDCDKIVVNDAAASSHAIAKLRLTDGRTKNMSTSLVSPHHHLLMVRIPFPLCYKACKKTEPPAIIRMGTPGRRMPCKRFKIEIRSKHIQSCNSCWYIPGIPGVDNA
jgi:hypothetical protein